MRSLIPRSSTICIGDCLANGLDISTMFRSPGDTRSLFTLYQATRLKARYNADLGNKRYLPIYRGYWEDSALLFTYRSLVILFGYPVSMELTEQGARKRDCVIIHKIAFPFSVYWVIESPVDIRERLRSIRKQ